MKSKQQLFRFFVKQVNQNHPEEAGVTEWSRKVDARYYIDDRGIPPFQGWGETFQMIFPDEVAPIKRKRFFLF